MFSSNSNNYYTPWNIPSLDLKKELTNPEQSLSDKPYTLFNPNYVFRNAKEIAELMSVFPEYETADVIHLISFKPERIVLHQLITAVALNLKLKNEMQFNALLHDLYAKIISSVQFSEMMEKFYCQRDLLSEIIVKLLHQKPVSFDYFKADEGQIKQTLLNVIKKVSEKKNVFGNFIDNYNQLNAIHHLAIDTLYKKLIVPEINTYVDQIIQAVISEREDLKLTIPDIQERLTLMVAGGQASGKTSSITVLQEKLKVEDFTHFLKLNTDEFKPILLRPGSVNPYIYSQLVQPEASYVSTLIKTTYEKLLANQQAPHFYIDQVIFEPRAIDLLYGKKFIGLVVSTRLEDAMQRSFERGQQVPNQQGRFEHTEGILSGHQLVASNFFKNILNFVKQNVCVEIYDNNVSFGNKPIRIMSLKLSDDKLRATIFDAEKIKEFMKKLTINVHATKSEDIYPSNWKEMVDNLYRQFIKDLENNQLTIVYEGQSNNAQRLTNFGTFKTPKQQILFNKNKHHDHSMVKQI